MIGGVRWAVGGGLQVVRRFRSLAVQVGSSSFYLLITFQFASKATLEHFRRRAKPFCSPSSFALNCALGPPFFFTLQVGSFYF